MVHRTESLKSKVGAWIRSPRVDLAVVALVLLNVAALIVEIAFHDDPRVAQAARAVADALLGVFSIELAVRLWVAPHKRRFLRRYALDLLSLIPLFQPLRLLRVLTLLRLLRVGMLLNRRVVLLGGILRGTVLEVAFIATLTFVTVLFGASMYALNPGSVPDVHDDLGEALWFSAYTFFAGEPPVQPETGLGRLVTLGVMFAGLNVFGVFVGSVSAGMVSALSRRIEVTLLDLDELSDHLIVLGWNGSATTLLRELFGPADAPFRGVVVVTEQPFAADACPVEVPRELLFTYTGDFTRVPVLEAVGVARAARVIVLSDTQVPRSEADRDARTVLAALTIERIAPAVFCCAELVDAQHEPILRLAGVEEIVITNRYAGLLLGSVVRNEGLTALLDDLLSVRKGSAFYKAELPARLGGRTVGELFAWLKETHDAVLISVERPRSSGGVDEHINPPTGLRLEGGDVLVVVARQPVTL